MPLVIECPRCAARLKVADTLAGKVANCPKCKSAMTVPTPVEDAGFTVVDDPPVVAPKREPARPQPVAPWPQAIPAMAQSLVSAPAFADPTPPAPLPPEPPAELPVATPAERPTPTIAEPAVRPKSVKPKPPLTMRIGDIGPRTRPDRAGEWPTTDKAETRLETRRGPVDETATARPAMAQPVSARGPRKPDLHPAVFYGILAVGLLFAAGWGYSVYLMAGVTTQGSASAPRQSNQYVANFQAPPPTGWTPFSPSQGGFRIYLPGPASIESLKPTEVRLGDGRQFIAPAARYHSSGGDPGNKIECSVTVYTFTKNSPVEKLNSFLRSKYDELRSKGMELSEETKVTMTRAGGQGTEVVLKPDGDFTSKRRSIYRWVVVGDKGYLLSIRGLSERPKEADGFFNSLTQLPDSPSAPKPTPLALSAPPQPIPPSKTTPQGWESVVSHDHVFRVAFPKATMPNFALLPTEFALPVAGESHGTAVTGQGTFTAGYLQFVDAKVVPKTDRLRSYVPSIAPGGTFRVGNETSVTVGGRKWTEIRIRFSDKPARESVYRFLVDGPRVYFQTISTYSGPPSPETERLFFGSYEILTPDS
jgi:hypothetical protein